MVDKKTDDERMAEKVKEIDRNVIHWFLTIALSVFTALLICKYFPG